MVAAGLNDGGDARTGQVGQNDKTSEPPVSSAEHEQPSPAAARVAAGLNDGGDARTGQVGQNAKTYEPQGSTSQN
jgi:hypothetical protein